MEQWDIVKLYARAMRSQHYIEAVCLGYMHLEYILEVLLTNTTLGKTGRPLTQEEVNEADYLRSRAKLAFTTGFIDKRLYDDILEFNKLRGDIIHKLVKKQLEPADLKRAAEKVGPLYKRVQDLFLTIEISAVTPKSN